MKYTFHLFALLSLAAAIYHGIGLFCPVNDAPLWRHALFIGLNVICLFGFLRRPRWFVWYFGALTLQQCYSHGGSFLNELNDQAAHFPWLDLGVVLFMLLAMACLIMDQRREHFGPQALK